MTHEFNAISKMIEILSDWAKKDNIEKILEVHFEVGEYLLTTPENVRSHFRMLSKNTVAEGAKIYVKKRKGVMTCFGCGYIGRGKKALNIRKGIKVPSMTCPKCGGTTKIIQGREYVISKIRFKRKGSDLAEEALYDG
ncbi:MAG: hydrogenase maturation nickel metallochaperone HypA [Nitrososphaeria archaeon]